MAINAIKRILGQPSTIAVSSHEKSSHHNETLTSTSLFGLGVAEAAKRYLATVKQPKSVPEITDALKTYGLQSTSKNFNIIVFSALDRREGDLFVRPKRGLWGLKEWYPGARIKPKDSGDPKESEAEGEENAKKTETPEVKPQLSVPPPPRKPKTPSSTLP